MTTCEIGSTNEVPLNTTHCSITVSAHIIVVTINRSSRCMDLAGKLKRTQCLVETSQDCKALVDILFNIHQYHEGDFQVGSTIVWTGAKILAKIVGTLGYFWKHFQ